MVLLERSVRADFRADWQPLNDLDARAPRIGDVGDGVAGGSLADRLIELDAHPLEALDERRVIVHVEADVIEHAVARRRLRRVGRVSAHLPAAQADYPRVGAR